MLEGSRRRGTAIIGEISASGSAGAFFALCAATSLASALSLNCQRITATYTQAKVPRTPCMVGSEREKGPGGASSATAVHMRRIGLPARDATRIRFGLRSASMFCAGVGAARVRELT